MKQAFRFDSQRLLGQIKGLAEAVQFIHTPAPGSNYNGGVRNDIKPDNILFQWSSHRLAGHLVLTDFDNALLYNAGNSDKMNSTQHGSAEYKPLECRKEQCSVPCDVWALGCVFMEMMTWALDGPESVESFETRRWKECKHHAGWFIEDQDEYPSLRPSVVSQLDHLHAEAGTKDDDTDRYQLMVKVVETMMLAVNRKERAEVGHVARKLGKAHSAPRH
ncbi:hypothetical protein MMC25_005951 [Agyrium rufum]|nr:hypothetical protein [Agyrium rufum]